MQVRSRGCSGWGRNSSADQGQAMHHTRQGGRLQLVTPSSSRSSYLCLSTHLTHYHTTRCSSPLPSPSPDWIRLATALPSLVSGKTRQRCHHPPRLLIRASVRHSPRTQPTIHYLLPLIFKTSNLQRRLPRDPLLASSIPPLCLPHRHSLQPQWTRTMKSSVLPPVTR